MNVFPSLLDTLEGICLREAVLSWWNHQLIWRTRPSGPSSPGMETRRGGDKSLSQVATRKEGGRAESPFKSSAVLGV